MLRRRIERGTVEDETILSRMIETHETISTTLERYHKALLDAQADEVPSRGNPLVPQLGDPLVPQLGARVEGLEDRHFGSCDPFPVLAPLIVADGAPASAAPASAAPASAASPASAAPASATSPANAAPSALIDLTS
jgi:hypothetical protein